ncbi:MAG: AraC family transcriptional regulator [Spirochaetota bacterium]|nr:AraC family transcriptional regulator [Spirochaetota bacterium]
MSYKPLVKSLVREVGNTHDVHDLSNFNELKLPLPEEIARGYVYHIYLQDNFFLLITDQINKEPMRGISKLGRKQLIFPFLLISEKCHTIIDEGSKEKLSHRAGEAHLLLLPDEYYVDFPPGHYLFITLACDMSFLTPLIQDYDNHIPQDFLQILLDKYDEPYYQNVCSITPAMKKLIDDILRCPYKGTLKKFYLEARALELLCLRLEQLFLDFSKEKNIKLKPSDIDRIMCARDILLKNYTNPPSLKELAQKVNLNINKLNFGFKELFNNTPLGLVRDTRLELSHLLIAEKKIPITEVAYTVGYNDLSYFAEAFRKKFGVNPGSLLKM